MNINLLQGIFTISDNPGLDSTDPRLDEITTLSQAGQFSEAAALSETLIAEGVYDVRLICFFLYGYWLDNGISSMLPLLDSLTNVIQENWQAIGPKHNQEKYLEKSLDWLFRQLLKKLQYEESKNSSVWQQWQASAVEVDFDQITASALKLRDCLNQRMPDTALVLFDQWRKIEKWLDNFQRLSYQPEPDEPSELNEDGTEEAMEMLPMSAAQGVNPTEKTAGAANDAALQGLESSYYLELLLKKLAAFEQLIQENKFPQAALLSDDINFTLANFDPKLYFPKMFENFVKQQVLFFDELMVYAEHRDDPQWQAMQEWLKVDLDGFINN